MGDRLDRQGEALRLFRRAVSRTSGGFDLPVLMELRDELLVLEAYLSAPGQGRPLPAGLQELIGYLRDLTDEFISVQIEMRDQIKSKDFNEFARSFSMGKDLLLALSDIREQPAPMPLEYLMSGLAVAGSYIANTGYVASAVENINILLEKSRLRLQERLFELTCRTRPKVARHPEKARKALGEIGGFLDQFQRGEILPIDKMRGVLGCYTYLMYSWFNLCLEGFSVTE